jgi:hypothetical protein
MAIEFDFANVVTTEFGVGINQEEQQAFYLIPVDNDVQTALREMTVATTDAMRALAEEPARYEPAEKHEGNEYLQLPIGDDLAARMRMLHQANNLNMNAEALEEPEDLFCYFTRLTDGRGRRLTGLRRASQFKGVLKKRLIRFSADAMKLVEDDVFKLDSDFDLLIDANNVHVLRPKSFELVSELQAAIMNAVPTNIGAIGRQLEFVDFAGIQAYAARHPRAARYLASIRNQPIQNISRRGLTDYCRANGVEIQRAGRKIAVSDDHVMAFLEILDRRRYEVSLVADAPPELFRAGSREKIE